MTEVNISDDGRVEIDLPFTFPLFGETFTKSWMYSNGVVGFMSAPSGYVPSFCCSGFSEEQIASQLAQGSLPQFAFSIAALWTDLVDTNVDRDGDGIDDTGFFYHAYDTDSDGKMDTMRYFWRGISEFYNPETSNTFEVKIDEIGGVEITHFEIDIRNHTYTVGVFGSKDGEYQVFEYGQSKITNPNDGSEVYIFNFDLDAACAANPLFSSTCVGYAEAYAELIYTQSCAANPLYDIGCPGYEQAYYNYQCSADPLYDMGCNGYAEAYYEQQCSLDPLYDSGCTGYEVAYFNQQCELDSLYDEACPGYELAYYNEYVLPGLQEQEAQASGQSEETTAEADIVAVQDPVATLTRPEITGDAVVDQVLRGTSTGSTNNVIGQNTIEITQTPTETVESTSSSQVEESREATSETDTAVAALEAELDGDQSSGDVDERVEEGGDEASPEGESGSDGDSQDGGSGGSESRESSGKTDSEKKQSRENKIRQIAKQRAMQLADRMSNAASLEAQQAVQATILSLINFNPDFARYANGMEDGSLPYDQQMPDGKIPPPGRGLLNGLASQILHDKMVDMQYD